MPHPRSVDASRLPREGFTVTSPAWWGTLGFMVIEGSSLLLCAAAYVYLSRRSPAWPPPGTPPPDLRSGTVMMAALLVSLVPALILNRAARTLDRGVVLRWLLISLAVEAIVILLRVFELQALPVRWDHSAYGSTIWFTIGVHTTLLIFDLFESLGFTALFLWGPVDRRHFADVADAMMYWCFIVIVWVPLYFMLYLSPRL